MTGSIFLPQHNASNVIYALWFLSITLISGCSAFHTPSMLATQDIEDYNRRLEIWNAAKQSRDVKKMFDFASAHSNFIMNWQNPAIIYQGLDVAVAVKWKTGYQYYHDTFLPEIQQTIDLMHLYQRAITSHNDADIASLAIFVKTHPLYANILDDPAISNEHEKAVFALVTAKNILPAYDDFLSWYPAGAYATEATTLRNNLAAIEQDAEKKVALLQKQGVEEAQKFFQQEQERLDQQRQPQQYSQPIKTLREANYPPVAIRLFQAIKSNEEKIFKDAHGDEGAIVSSDVNFGRITNTTTEIIQDILWSNSYGQYETKLQFTGLYSNQDKLDKLDVVSLVDDFPGTKAFKSLNLYKDAASEGLDVLSGVKTKTRRGAVSRIAAGVVSTALKFTSVEDCVTHAIKCVANEKSDGSCKISMALCL